MMRLLTTSVNWWLTVYHFSDVCWLRLDFESFTLLGPTVSTETQGGLCPDTFKVTVSYVILFCLDIDIRVLLTLKYLHNTNIYTEDPD